MAKVMPKDKDRIQRAAKAKAKVAIMIKAVVRVMALLAVSLTWNLGFYAATPIVLDGSSAISSGRVHLAKNANWFSLPHQESLCHHHLPSLPLL